MQRSIIRIGAGMASLLLLAAVAYAGEEEVPLESVPKPVMDAAKARFPNAAVTGTATEMDGDKLAYEVSLKDDGQIIHMILSPEGEIVLFERAITAGDLPRVVAKTLEDKYPDATYEIVEELFTVENKEEKLTYYEVRLKTAKEEAVKLKLTPDGAIAAEKEADSEGNDAIAAKEETDSEDDDANAAKEDADSEDDDASAGEEEEDSEDDDTSAGEEEEDSEDNGE
ncbi:MAG: PepSY-like domain-containing protein [Chromatiales bacterium]